MATLIGAGGHADDIWDSLPSTAEWVRVAHHKDLQDVRDLVVIGINDPQVRAAVATELGIKDFPWKHPHAYSNATSWGFGTHINYGVTMTRTTIGNHVTIAPGVTICGDVTIGDRVFIGAGATIINRIAIGDDAFIRAGSVVTRDVAPGERY